MPTLTRFLYLLAALWWPVLGQDALTGSHSELPEYRAECRAAPCATGPEIVERNLIESAAPVSVSSLRHTPPKKARRLFDQGMSDLRKGRTAQAVERFSEAARVDPAYVSALAQLGSLSLLQGDAPSALRHYENALHYDARSEALLLGKTLALLQLRRPAEAEPVARMALKVSPDSVVAHYLLAGSLSAQDRITPELVEHLTAAAGRFASARAELARVQFLLAQPRSK